VLATKLLLLLLGALQTVVPLAFLTQAIFSRLVGAKESDSEEDNAAQRQVEGVANAVSMLGVTGDCKKKNGEQSSYRREERERTVRPRSDNGAYSSETRDGGAGESSSRVGTGVRECPGEDERAVESSAVGAKGKSASPKSSVGARLREGVTGKTGLP
jgi:hypothetical protein